jgi:nucleoside-diphosphate-sugar epimerase
MSRLAYVTGGTGFVGLNLIDALLKQDWQVTALHRPSSDLTYLKRFAAARVAGSLTDAASLPATIPPDTDTIFHVAGNTNMWRQKNPEQTKDNVEGTRNIVEAAITRGVRRLIVTSSISAYGPVKGTVTEKTPSLAANSWVNYERTKYEAQELARAATARGLEVVIMQPGAIMGPYDIGTWSRLFPLVRDGKLPGVPPANLSFTHVHECVAAHIVAADKGENGGAYLLAGTPGTMLDLVQQIAKLLNKPAPKSASPAWLLKIVAQIADAASIITRKPPIITPEMASGLGGRDLVVDCTKAKTELGYKTVPLETMVQDCFNWLRTENRI